MEVELGPCAEFSLYHLMDLDPGEQRLFPVHSNMPQTLEGPLLRGTISRIGKGSSKLRNKNLIEIETTIDPRSQGAEHIAPTPDQPVQDPKILSDLCRILRSKNAGPYEITIDAMFSSKIDYDTIKASGILSSSNVAKAIGITKEDIIWIGFFDPALSFKVTIPRIRMGVRKSAGGFMENDIHGSQEHIGLANMTLPENMFSR